jgi:uncharacterized phage infection (PIP) family protein YhgE
MAGQLDEGVVKLEQFIGVLRTTIDQVSETTGTLESQADDLGDLEGTTESGFEDLGDALEDLEEGLDNARQDAVDEVGELTSLAQEATGQRLGEAEGEVESTESSFEGTMSEGRAETDRAHSSLNAQGFDALATTIEGVESALDASRHEASQGFDDLDSGVKEFTGRAGESFKEAEGKFAEGVSDVDQKSAALVTEAGDCVSGFESDGSEFQGEMTSLGGDLVSLYEGWDGSIEAAADDLESSVKTLVDDTAEFVSTGGSDQVEVPAGLVLNDSFAPYLVELGELQGVLEGAASGPADTLVPLVDELEKSESVIDTIDKLLNAVE